MRQRTVMRLVIMLATVLFISSCGATGTASPTAAPTAASTVGEATQTNEEGQVIITATWEGRAAGPVFTVALNTHNVDLDAIELQTLAALRVDGVLVQPIAWDAPTGGHHRSGTLSFPTTTSDGQQLIRAQTTTVELLIRGVAGVPERSFQWTASS
jgi:hypothetical protein